MLCNVLAAELKRCLLCLFSFSCQSRTKVSASQCVVHEQMTLKKRGGFKVTQLYFLGREGGWAVRPAGSALEQSANVKEGERSITALPHIPHLTHPEKQKGPTYLPYAQTRFTLKLMKFKLQGPPRVHASFKALERVLEMFHMVDYFFAKFAEERYFNHNQLWPLSLSILTFPQSHIL